MSRAVADRDRRLLAYVGHQLRNPLAAAMVNISVVNEMVDEGDPRRPRLSQALADLERVADLLTSLLAFGRAGVPELRPVDLAQVVRRVAERVCPSTSRVTAPADAAVMQGDGRLLEQAIENLMHNSVSAGATMVEIIVDREPGELVLHIEDNGRGVPADIGERIFDPMVSGRGSTGLGLAMAREIIEAHGGSLNLLPTSSGALFRISLPSAA